MPKEVLHIIPRFRLKVHIFLYVHRSEVAYYGRGQGCGGGGAGGEERLTTERSDPEDREGNGPKPDFFFVNANVPSPLRSD